MDGERSERRERRDWLRRYKIMMAMTKTTMMRTRTVTMTVMAISDDEGEDGDDGVDGDGVDGVDGDGVDVDSESKNKKKLIFFIKILYQKLS